METLFAAIAFERVDIQSSIVLYTNEKYVFTLTDPAAASRRQMATQNTSKSCLAYMIT